MHFNQETNLFTEKKEVAGQKRGRGIEDNFVSIIVPAYNCEKTLPRCLDSIVNQSYKEFEILVIDDGSKDGTGVICDQYESRVPCLRAIHHLNQGVSVTRNRGIQEAQGMFLAFVDSDDWLEPDAISHMVATLREQDADWVIGGYKKHEHGQEKHLLPCSKPMTMNRAEVVRDLLSINTRPFYHMPWNKLYKTELIKENALRFDPAVCMFEDLLFNFAYIKHANTIAYLPEEIYNYWMYAPNSLTKKSSRDLWYVQRILISSYYDLFRQNRLFEQNKPIIERFAIDCFKYEASRCIMFDKLSHKERKQYLSKIAEDEWIVEALQTAEVSGSITKSFVWLAKHHAYDLIILQTVLKNFIFQNSWFVYDLWKIMHS